MMEERNRTEERVEGKELGRPCERTRIKERERKDRGREGCWLSI
jgi:hypothetical protein